MKKTLALIITILFLNTYILAGQEFELSLSTKALNLIEIGCAKFSGNLNQKEKAREILNRDLKLSGIFQVIPEKNMNLINAPVKPDSPDMEQFLSVGAKILITGSLNTDEEGSIIFKAFVFDTNSGKKIISRIYKGEQNVLNGLIHSFSDELIYVFSGKRGSTRSKIAFVSDRTGFREVYVMDYDGSNQKQMTKLKSTTIFPAISPDRKMIAFTSYKKNNPDLYLLTIGKGIKTIYSAEGIGSTPDFSSDGKWIVFSASLNGNTDIYLYEIATEKTTRLTTGRAIDTSPRFSPNGKEIIFTSDRFGSPRIYLMTREGLNTRKLNTAGNYNDSPIWSQDGDKIAYVAMFKNKFDIFIYSITENKNYRLTSGQGSSEYPAFSPDGRRIAFCSNRSGKWQIYSINLNGANIVQLTTEGNNTCPFWVK